MLFLDLQPLCVCVCVCEEGGGGGGGGRGGGCHDSTSSYRSIFTDPLKEGLMHS